MAISIGHSQAENHSFIVQAHQIWEECGSQKISKSLQPKELIKLATNVRSIRLIWLRQFIGKMQALSDLRDPIETITTFDQPSVL